jgi:hypothetical protein
LRDRATGRLYIVDVAKTPFGPPAALLWSSQLRAVRLLSRAFKAEFLAS